MKQIKIDNSTRKLSKENIIIGYLEENNIEKIKFEIPEEFKDYNKKVCLKAGDVVFGKLLDNDILILTSDITQYSELDLSIEFFDNDNNIIARTSKMHLVIEDTIVCEDVNPDEPKVIILNELIERVENFIRGVDINYVHVDDYMVDKETFLTEYDLIDYAKVGELEQKVAIIPYKSTYIEEEATKYGQLITNSFDESWSALNPLYVSYLGMMIPYSSRLNTTNLLFSCELTNNLNTIHYLELQVEISDDNKLVKIEKVLDTTLIDEVDLQANNEVINQNINNSRTIYYATSKGSNSTFINKTNLQPILQEAYDGGFNTIIINTTDGANFINCNGADLQSLEVGKRIILQFVNLQNITGSTTKPNRMFIGYHFANYVTVDESGTIVIEGSCGKSAYDYVDLMREDGLTKLTGYDSSKTQVLKNINGTIQWIDEEEE